MREETAILAGGCYWGAQELIRRQPGVVSTRVGWSGGDTPNPTDDEHGDHAEAVEIIYDTDSAFVPGSPGVLLPDPRSDHVEPPGRGRRAIRPFGHLLYQ